MNDGQGLLVGRMSSWIEVARESQLSSWELESETEKNSVFRLGHVAAALPTADVLGVHTGPDREAQPVRQGVHVLGDLTL